ncbi:MAG: hypothetical protein HY973_04240 [Candidatus Kerfeldbacteria bacterium]|nr:hypothetical protein [Candidatus Kerfeldbacteria bacterium]
MKKSLNLLGGLLLVPVTAYVAAMAAESKLGTFVDFQTLAMAVGVTVVVVAILHFIIKLPKFWAGAMVIGILISPYVQFLVGKVNIFLTDPPNLRPSVSVPEIRVAMGDLIFVNDQNQEITVLPASGVKTLYPGENIVNLGQLNIPAGTYKSGKMSIKNMEVDMKVDLAKEAELAYSQFEKMFKPLIPADMPAAALAQLPNETDIKARIKAGMKDYINRQAIEPYLPSFIKIKSLANDGQIIRMTLATQIDLPPLPIAFPYPTGTGGPDIVLDITLNEIGLPVGIIPIIKLPPGAPQINIPDLTPKLGDLKIPNDFGLPQNVLDQIKAEVTAAVTKGETLRQQLENKQPLN